MKRWNWPTTILYIKHKKANLKQRCSKLVGKKRKAPSEGWSGGLNCPFGTGEEMHWHVPLRASGAAGPRHYPRPGTAEGARQPRPGGACTDQNRPGAAELGTVLRSYSAERDHRSAQIMAARNPLHFSSLGLHSPDPSRCPGCGLPPRGPGTAERSARQRASCRHGSLGGS